MIVWLSHYLADWYHAFTVLQYVTLRAIFSALSAFILTLWLGPYVIKWLIRTQVGQVVRDDGPKSHYVKSGTPTMGGVLIILAVSISCLLWGQLDNAYLWITLLTLFFFGAIGFIDDYKKLVLKNSKGLRAKFKYFWQSFFGLLAVGSLYYLAKVPEATILYVPMFKNIAIPLGIFYLVFSYFVIVGTSNAVNLTDGLDGLAIMPVVMIIASLGLLAYVTGHVGFAGYLHLPYIAGAEEICIFAASVVGAGLGFLWFNAYPAQVFMGDVGSLALGAALGVIAVIIRQELLLFIMGGVFVVETISVIMQVGSYKLTGRRIFKMAPIHHHFELLGWPEPRIIIRFWIITVVLVLLSLASLKMR